MAKSKQRICECKKQRRDGWVSHRKEKREKEEEKVEEERKRKGRRRKDGEGKEGRKERRANLKLMKTPLIYITKILK